MPTDHKALNAARRRILEDLLDDLDEQRVGYMQELIELRQDIRRMQPPSVHPPEQDE